MRVNFFFKYCMSMYSIAIVQICGQNCSLFLFELTLVLCFTSALLLHDQSSWIYFSKFVAPKQFWSLFKILKYHSQHTVNEFYANYVWLGIFWKYFCNSNRNMRKFWLLPVWPQSLMPSYPPPHLLIIFELSGIFFIWLNLL